MLETQSNIHGSNQAASYQLMIASLDKAGLVPLFGLVCGARAFAISYVLLGVKVTRSKHSKIGIAAAVKPP